MNLPTIPQEIHDIESEKASSMYDSLGLQAVALGATKYAMLLLIGSIIDDMVAEGTPRDEVFESVRDAADAAAMNREQAAAVKPPN